MDRDRRSPAPASPSSRTACLTAPRARTPRSLRRLPCRIRSTASSGQSASSATAPPTPAGRRVRHRQHHHPPHRNSPLPRNSAGRAGSFSRTPTRTALLLAYQLWSRSRSRLPAVSRRRYPESPLGPTSGYGQSQFGNLGESQGPLIAKCSSYRHKEPLILRLADRPGCNYEGQSGHGI